tara:strand:- start:1339 stop:1899 length:561 start_codon:yes stop_codon:yes gene_type:complete
MFKQLVIFNNDESTEIFNYLKEKEIEYHKPYKRYNKIVKVPRGQASYTLNDNIHYNYGVSGGSPINEVMDDKLKEITKRVNDVLQTNFNTILMNVYKDGKDCIGFHKDKEKDWVENTGFATLSFGANRDFLLRNNESKETISIIHTNGSIIYCPYPINHTHQHAIPKRLKVKECRISLTFREIISK